MAFFNIGLSILSSYTQNTESPGKLLSAEGRRILSLLDGRPILDGDISKDENGRPYFPGRGTDFNISHSGSISAVSIVSGEKARTGCDIEFVRPRVSAKKIAESYFSPPERDYIFSGDSLFDIRFFTIWTLKECFLKLRGLSVFDMPKAPSFVCDEKPQCLQFSSGQALLSPLSFYIYELLGPSGEIYLLSVAIENYEQLKPELRWFSQSFLPARSIAEIKAAPSPTETVSPKM